MANTALTKKVKEPVMTLDQLKDYPYVLKFKLPANVLSGDETKRVLKGFKRLTGADMAIVLPSPNDPQLWIPIKEVQSAKGGTAEAKVEETLKTTQKKGLSWFAKWF